MFWWSKKCFRGRMWPCKDHSVAERHPKLRGAWKVIQTPTELISTLKLWIYVWMFCINAWRTYFSLLRSQKYIFKQQFERKFKLSSHLGLNFSKNGWVVLENELFKVEVFFRRPERDFQCWGQFFWRFLEISSENPRRFSGMI